MNDLRWKILDLSYQEDCRRRNQMLKRRLEEDQDLQEDSSRQIPRRYRVKDPFECMSEEEFINNYRLDKNTVKELIDLLTPHMRVPKRRNCMSVETRVLLALAFYASGSYQMTVGESDINSLSQSSVSRSTRQVTKALNTPEVLKQWVQFPCTKTKRDNVKQGFYNKYKMPSIVGAIDGTHVRIIRPRTQDELYLNKKGYHSLNVMIICDSEMRILCVDPSNPGSRHDNIAWQMHPLHNYLKNRYDTEELYLLGDNGYSLRQIMMTPTTAEPDTPEAHYNSLHQSAHNVVERCIGTLKARFRCLLATRRLHYTPLFARQIVNACAVLHNMALQANLPVPPLTAEQRRNEALAQIRIVAAEAELRPQEEQHNIHRRINLELIQGRTAQQELINRLWEDRDAVS